MKTGMLRTCPEETHTMYKNTRTRTVKTGRNRERSHTGGTNSIHWAAVRPGGEYWCGTGSAAPLGRDCKPQFAPSYKIYICK